MLHLWLEEQPENYTWHTDEVFDVDKDVSWFNDKRVIEAIKIIDDTDVTILKPYDASSKKNNYIIESPVFGYITPNELSTGVKTYIMLLLNKKYTFSSLRMGDNVLELIEKVSEHEDMTLCMETSYFFSCKVHILNDDSYTDNKIDFMKKFMYYRGKAVDRDRELGYYDVY